MQALESPPEGRRGPYHVSADPAAIALDAVHAYLTRSYWSPGIPRDVVRRAIAGSVCCGLFHARDGQVGFARAVTDRATFGYLADVYVLEAHRGLGLGAWLVETLLARPELQGLRRMMLATRDAHPLYARFGFTPLAAPDRIMERVRRDPYGAAAAAEGAP